MTLAKLKKLATLGVILSYLGVLVAWNSFESIISVKTECDYLINIFANVTVIVMCIVSLIGIWRPRKLIVF